MITKKWDQVLESEYRKPYFLELVKNVRKEYQTKTCFPPADMVFEAMKLTDYDQVRVVILGQDPYHGVGEAEGLAFSVQDNVKMPPSLVNIFKELHDDLGYDIPKTGSLRKWASQGVLLLNAILSVEKDKPASHRGLGWELFTDQIIRVLNQKETPIVFILWGNYAKSKKELITNPIHLVLTSSHPSPFSCNNGFFGSKPFSKTNEFLIKNKISPINFDLN